MKVLVSHVIVKIEPIVVDVEDGDEENKTRILNENDRILFLFSPVETDRRKEKKTAPPSAKEGG